MHEFNFGSRVKILHHKSALFSSVANKPIIKSAPPNASTTTSNTTLQNEQSDDKLEFVDLVKSFQIVQVPKDGNCFFHSILLCLEDLTKNTPSSPDESFSGLFNKICTSLCNDEWKHLEALRAYILRQVVFYVIYQLLFEKNQKLENYGSMFKHKNRENECSSLVNDAVRFFEKSVSGHSQQGYRNV